jgi:hypothetical protein
MVEVNPDIWMAVSGWWQTIEVNPDIWTTISGWWHATLAPAHE